MARDTRSRGLERGLITTDSRHQARRQAVRPGAPGRSGGDALPDVTAFVARRRDLAPEVSERVFSDRRGVSRGDVWERPEGSRSISPRTRSAAPRGGGPETLDAWRRESGRLRNGVMPSERSADPRARSVTPTPRSTETTSWWQDRAGRAAPRGATRDRPSRPGAAPQPGDEGARVEERPPVVRRVWEGIRDRQRAQPTAPATANGAPSARQPSTERRSGPSRPTPSTQPRSAPSRPSPSTREGSQPSRRAPSTERRAEPPRRQPSTRSNGSGSARRSEGSGSRPSSEGSSRGRSARRRPPR